MDPVPEQGTRSILGKIQAVQLCEPGEMEGISLWDAGFTWCPQTFLLFLFMITATLGQGGQRQPRVNLLYLVLEPSLQTPGPQSVLLQMKTFLSPSPPRWMLPGALEASCLAEAPGMFWVGYVEIWVLQAMVPIFPSLLKNTT